MKKMISYKKSQSTGESGFTIVELMLATLVFSVILLVITAGVISFTHSYYRGITNSTTQTTTQGAVDAITQSIQFSGLGQSVDDTLPPSATPNTVQSFCAGGRQFVYVLYHQLRSDATNLPGLYMRNRPTGCATPSITPTAPLTGGTELLSNRMRVASVIVKQEINGSYTLSLRVAYGDTDLLNNPSAPTTTCMNATGQQFCDVSVISTSVVRRVAF